MYLFKCGNKYFNDQKTMNRLTAQQIEQFIDSGYVKIEDAFPKEIADKCRSMLWQATGLNPNEPETWTEPVIRISVMDNEFFQKAANTNILHRAFHQLAGDNWIPRTSLGSFPIRFPSEKKSMDTGWHVDASFPGDDPNNYFEWRINVNSKGRALLMLFLFSDVTEKDAPTLIREGSHLDIAAIVKPEGPKGLSFMELAQKLDRLPKRNRMAATGNAGTVYLCHPFLVHAAQQHRGKMPKFMAQPPLLTKRDFNIYQPYESCCPVEKAILKGINN